MVTKVAELPAFQLKGWSACNIEGKVVTVTWEELRAAHVGKTWKAVASSDCLRGSYSEAASVVYRNGDGVAIMFRSWGWTNDEHPQLFTNDEVVWFDFSDGTSISLGRPAD